MRTNGGSSDGYLKGDLKRRLPSIRLLNFTSSEDTEPSGTRTFKVLLRNLSNVLTFQIVVAIVNVDGDPMLPNSGILGEVNDGGYPPNPGICQLIPITNFPDSPKAYLRPVFQDPSSINNTNAPLPQEIPFGWNDNAETDEVQVLIAIDVGSYLQTNVNGFLEAQAMVEYNGEWWDVEAIDAALSQVQFGPGTAPSLETIGTGIAG